MNDLEKTQPHMAQEVSGEALQEKLATFQERFPILDEEQLEEIVGGGNCCPAGESSVYHPEPQHHIDMTLRPSRQEIEEIRTRLNDIDEAKERAAKLKRQTVIKYPFKTIMEATLPR